MPLPAVAITYLAPPDRSKDTPALTVAQAILSGGESSRLYQQLVYRQQIAQEASFNLNNHVDKGWMYFSATLASGKKPEDAEKSLLAELKKMQAAPVAASELTKAKNTLVAEAIRQIETNQGKAMAIGQSVILRGSAQAVNNQVKELQAVTAADIQRVMRQYFTDKNRVVIYYENEENGK